MSQTRCMRGFKTLEKAQFSVNDALQGKNHCVLQ